MLQALSFHFGMSVDILLKSNLDNFTLPKLSFGGRERIGEVVKIVLPIAWSENSVKDPWFKKGYDLHRKMIETSTNAQPVYKESFVACYELYQKSIEENKTIESIANILCLIFIMWDSMDEKRTLRILEACRNPCLSEETLIKEYFWTNLDAESIEIRKKRQEFLDDLDETIMISLSLLKSTSEWSCFADYYLALKYVMGMVDIDLSYAEKKIIGTEMMRVFGLLRNPYAQRYVNEIQSK